MNLNKRAFWWCHRINLARCSLQSDCRIVASPDFSINKIANAIDHKISFFLLLRIIIVCMATYYGNRRQKRKPSLFCLLLVLTKMADRMLANAFVQSCTCTGDLV